MRLAVLLALLLVANAGMGKTVAELERDNQLGISSSVLPTQQIVAGQKIEMAIDIATNRWFAGGTRLRLPEVAGLIILQTNDFASNSTEQRHGQTWVIQRWTLDVYPQRSGSFTIPPVSATVSVNDESSGVVKGTLYSPPVQFKASLPEGLNEGQHWVAAPSFSVTQRFDKDTQQLLAGDALSREVIFEATEVMAMMLPSLKTENIAGFAAYAKAPELTNKSNRGTTTAKRVERITYIAESEGRYMLPAQTYSWWDTQTQALRARSIPEVEIIVGAGSAASQTTANPQRQALNFWPVAYAVLALISFVFMLWLGWRIMRSSQFQRCRSSIAAGWQRIKNLTKPTLPSTLNPDNNAEG